MVTTPSSSSSASAMRPGRLRLAPFLDRLGRRLVDLQFGLGPRCVLKLKHGERQRCETAIRLMVMARRNSRHIDGEHGRFGFGFGSLGGCGLNSNGALQTGAKLVEGENVSRQLFGRQMAVIAEPDQPAHFARDTHDRIQFDANSRNRLKGSTKKDP